MGASRGETRPQWLRMWKLRALANRIGVGLLLLVLLLAGAARAQVRIKDIADVDGVRANQLVGYGLVVGLNGTGDKLDNAAFTRESLIAMLERLGVNTADLASKVQTKNVAAVMVTSTLPAFAHPGDHMDVTVSALGDAKDLAGGTLLVTPLMGADGNVYAVAQGAVSTGAVQASGQGASVTRNIPTQGKVPNGASVERGVNFSFNDEKQLRFSLRNPDLTTAMRMVAVINEELGPGQAEAEDPRTVDVKLGGRNAVETLAAVENLPVAPDSPATVVIDETSGTIVMGENVRISTVAIAQGNITIKVSETPQVSQPGAFSNGTTTTTPNTSIAINDQSDRKLGVMTSGATLHDLVSGLNALGVGPRDLISILQAIKAEGALQADLVIR